MPSSTVGFFVVPNVQRMQQALDMIKLGELASDPTVQPFIEDMRDQIQARVDRTGFRLGVSWEDLIEVCAGEVAIGFMQPKAAQKHAVVAMADMTGKEKAVTDLRAQIKERMAKRNADRTTKTITGVEVEVYEVPIKPGAKKRFTAVIFVTKNYLVATDHEQVAAQILANAAAGNVTDNTLAKNEVYRTTIERCDPDFQGLQPHFQWFIEPIAYAQMTRDATGTTAGSMDILKAVKNQGFESVQGMGGVANLGVGDFEFLHRGFIYAPSVAGAGDEKFEKAARVLAYPGKEPLVVQDWIPENVASFVTLTWDIQNAYQYAGSLIDEIAGEEGFFEDLKASLRDDPNGPMIDLDKDIVAHLGSRATLITDTVTPITTTSERFLLAIELSNPGAMAKSMERMLETDPNAEKIEVDSEVIWEIINDEEDAELMPSIEGEFGFGPEPGAEEEREIEPLLSNSAISVIKGHLVISSHVDFVVEMLRHDQTTPGLEESQDYQAVQSGLEKLGAKPDDIGRMFSRTDEEFHASYELIRRGEMPESEGLLGKLLNQVLGPEEKGETRDQRINGENMPDYQVVRRYLGPIGAFLQVQEDGFYSAGLGLAKDAPIAPEMVVDKVTTAERTEQTE